MQAVGLPSVTGSLSSRPDYIPNAGLPFGAKVACADAEHNNPYMHVMLSILESQTGMVPFCAFNRSEVCFLSLGKNHDRRLRHSTAHRQISACCHTVCVKPSCAHLPAAMSLARTLMLDLHTRQHMQSQSCKLTWPWTVS